MRIKSVLCAALLLLALWLSSGRAQDKNLWEYKVVAYKSTVEEATRTIEFDQKKIEEAVVPKFEALLNQLGGEGWELCAQEEGVFIFKRRK